MMLSGPRFRVGGFGQKSEKGERRIVEPTVIHSPLSISTQICVKSLCLSIDVMKSLATRCSLQIVELLLL